MLSPHISSYECGGWEVTLTTFCARCSVGYSILIAFVCLLAEMLRLAAISTIHTINKPATTTSLTHPLSFSAFGMSNIFPASPSRHHERLISANTHSHIILSPCHFTDLRLSLPLHQELHTRQKHLQDLQLRALFIIGRDQRVTCNERTTSQARRSRPHPGAVGRDLLAAQTRDDTEDVFWAGGVGVVSEQILLDSAREELDGICCVQPNRISFSAAKEQVCAPGEGHALAYRVSAAGLL